VRKPGVILLFLVLAYTQWGYYAQFIVLQWRLKEAAREAWVAALPDRAFLRVSLAEIDAHGRWEEVGKECWYRGHLYDVIRQRRAGATTWLFCLDDDNEERLIRQSDAVTRASIDQPARRQGHTLALAAYDWVCEDLAGKISAIPPILHRYFPGSGSPLPIRYTEQMIPPPKG
jgi:hypothetical protein